jgi:ZIP family zinc transporter
MLTASFTSLILPGIEFGGVWPVIIGMALGIIFLDLADHLTPHKHGAADQEDQGGVAVYYRHNPA